MMANCLVVMLEKIRQTLVLLLIAFAGVSATAEALPVMGGEPQVVSQADYRFTEGPTVMPDGSIAFSDIPNNRVLRYVPQSGETTTLFKDTGGANGLLAVLAFGPQSVFACAGRDQAVRLLGADGDVRLDHLSRSAAATQPNDAGESTLKPFRFNGPNDVTGSAEHGFYFTDPAYGGEKPGTPSFEGVYHTTLAVLATDQLPGIAFHAPTLVAHDLERPNGIALTADGQTLYIADNAARIIYAYDVVAPGKVENRRVFFDTDAATARFDNIGKNGGPDGMTLAPQGPTITPANAIAAVPTTQPASTQPGEPYLYVTLYDVGVVVLNAAGTPLGLIPTGKQTTNCVIGLDGSLYVTAQKALLKVTDPHARR